MKIPPVGYDDETFVPYQLLKKTLFEIRTLFESEQYEKIQDKLPLLRESASEMALPIPTLVESWISLFLSFYHAKDQNLKKQLLIDLNSLLNS